MKRLPVALGVLALLCACTPKAGDKPLEPAMTVLLYPQGQTVDAGIVENGTAVTLGPGEDNGLRGPEVKRRPGSLANVGDSARMEFFFPERPNGLLIVNMPGGGYSNLSTINEGLHAAEWLTSEGVTVCDVLYRMPNHHPSVPLTDVLNAIRYCRAHAAGWGIKKIGVMGYSAGGHLAATASTMFTDEVTRPDFSVLIYPVASLDTAITHMGTHNNLLPEDYTKEQEDAWSPDKLVGPDTPPTFIALSADDSSVPPECSFRYFDALARYGIPRQMHVYPFGGHGWGFKHEPFAKEVLQQYRPVFFAGLGTFLKDRLAAE